MGIVEAIAQGFRAVAEVFGYASKRSDAKNTADVKEAAKAQSSVDERNRIESSVEKRDVGAARKDWSE